MSINLHCCEDMKKGVEDQDIAVTYIEKFREYGISILDGGSSFLSIRFCPWCGQELPKSLRHKWFDELERLGVDPGDDMVPEKFSDERWYRELNL